MPSKRPPKHGGRRPGAGRPAIDPALRLSERAVVRLTPGERARLDAHCEREELPESAVIRARLVDILHGD